MPTYGYACDACGHRFEKFQPITEKPVKECPKCRRSRARRVISGGAGVIFKGTGFYQTDYRSKSYQEAAKKEAPQKKETPSTPAKTEKPEKKEKK